MTSTKWFQTEAEKYFLYIKLISFTGSPAEVEIQANDAFDITTIDSAYLNTVF